MAILLENIDSCLDENALNSLENWQTVSNENYSKNVTDLLKYPNTNSNHVSQCN